MPGQTAPTQSGPRSWHHLSATPKVALAVGLWGTDTPVASSVYSGGGVGEGG